MKVLYTWLKDFVETSASPAELKDRLSMAGLAVDAVEDSAAGPLLEPPVKCPRCHGLRAGGHGRSNEAPCANSCVASLPTSTAPASSSFSVVVAFRTG